MTRLQVAVIGGGICTAAEEQLAYEVGAALARSGAVLICGGRSGVMEAAALGAKDHGGTTIGILPGLTAQESPPNESIDVALFTDMGQARNAIVVQSAAAVIAIGGEWGTLSEIGLARKADIPVALLNSWKLEPPHQDALHGLFYADSAGQAVEWAIEHAAQSRFQ